MRIRQHVVTAPGITLSLGLVFSLLALGACSDNAKIHPDGATADADAADAGPTCSLQFKQINGRDVADVTRLGLADDRDEVAPGIQIDVVVAATGSDPSAVVGLSVTGLAADPSGAVVDGLVTLKQVTVGAALDSVLLTAYSSDCASDEISLAVDSVPECFFEQPVNGSGLGPSDDKTPGNSSFDVDVVLGTNDAAGGTAVLRVAGFAQPAQAVGADGKIRFNDVVLPVSQQVELEAELTVGTIKRTCRATVSVATSDPTCNIAIDPPPVVTLKGGDGLGRAQDALPATAQIETNIKVTTDARVDRVELFIDDVLASTLTPNEGSVTFEHQPLRTGTERTLSVSCTDTRTSTSSSSAIVTLDVDPDPPLPLQGFRCRVTNHRLGQITCQWDNMAQTAGVARFVVKQRTEGRLDSESWASADTLGTLGYPAIELDAQGLPLGHTYYIAARTEDNVLNASSIVENQPTTGQYGLVMDYKQEILERVENELTLGVTMTSGDFNCDGYADLAIGDPTYAEARGRVGIYLGSSSGYLQYPTKVIDGTSLGGRFGERVAALTNFDRDSSNCADLAVYASFGGSPAGKVYVYLGQPSLPDRLDVGSPGDNRAGADLVLRLPASAGADESVGSMLASAADFNGDLATDLALLYRNTAAGIDEAKIMIVAGDPSLTPISAGAASPTRELPAAAAVVLSGGKASDGFGSALCGTPSLDGDAFGELLIGASATSGGGRAYVLRGANSTGTVTLGDARVVAIDAGVGGVAFGQQVGFVGDMDGDSNREFAISDPAAADNAGAVYVFNLAGATQPTKLLTVTNDSASAAGDKLGVALGCAASIGSAGTDFNGDAKADLLVGAESSGTSDPGRVYLINGHSPLADVGVSASTYVFEPPAASVAFGAALSWVPDVNHDGFPDLAVLDAQSGGTSRVVIFY